MSKEIFTCAEMGKPGRPGNAFKKAKTRAFYWHGHSGGTGTIAEAGDYIVVTKHVPCDLRTIEFDWATVDRSKWKDQADLKYIETCIDNGWACCFLTARGTAWVFFGMAEN